MNKNELKEYYEGLKAQIALDGKSHQSTIVDDGIWIDGKFYGAPTSLINDGKSHQGIRTKDGHLYGAPVPKRKSIPQNRRGR